MTPIEVLAPRLDGIARSLDAQLAEAAGAPVRFALLVWDETQSTHVGNVDRATFFGVLQEVSAHQHEAASAADAAPSAEPSRPTPWRAERSITAG